MSEPADPAGAGDPSLGGWSFWNMQKNGGLSAASISTVRKNLGLSAASTSTVRKNLGLCAASTSAVKNEGYSTWTSVDGEWRPRSPVPTDPLAPEYYHDIAEFYLEAARRLPIADIPYLANCISYNGLAIGLADPVTNIILTSINAFSRRPFYIVPVPVPVMPNALEQTRKKTTFVAGAGNSRAGLITFLTCYFRNLTQAQARKCLDMAGHDLPLAVLLIETGRWGSQVPVLQPDAPRTKAALQQAVYDAGYSTTDDLVRLMTWRYPRDLLDPVLDDFRGGKQLSADCVYKICDLLRCSWPPPPPTPAPTPGTYRDNSGNVTTITMIRKDVFATTTISKDLVPTTTIISTCPSNDDYTDDSVHLSTVLAPERSSRVSNIVSSWREDPDFVPLLKMSLLDTVHSFYIEALGILPGHALREDHLIRAVLTAGHCYGPLDPVSNIILNSIWYDVIFPLSNAVSKKIGAADILDARSMSRVESRSLDGLVAFVCHTYSVPEQHAVVLLCENRFNLSSMLQGPNKVFFNFGSAALVAKHPQPAAFGDFLNSLTPSELDSLRSLVSDKGQGYVLSDDTLKRLKMMVSKKTPGSAAATVQTMAPKLGQSALWTVSERRSTFRSQQDYVRTRLENLLLDYGNHEGQIYKLGVICGVTTARYRGYRAIGTTCYHVNFLASTDVPNDATGSYCSRQLFFAEFWNIPYDRIEQSTNPPFCCPVGDSIDVYSIRCIICDDTSCMIAHPSSGEHVYFTGNAEPRFPVHHQWGADLGGMLEFDFIYFDRESHESAKILLEELSSSARKMQIFC